MRTPIHMNKTNKGTREQCAMSTTPRLQQLEDEVLAVLDTKGGLGVV